uniref:Hemolysin-type calcium-binding repeat-containing protein n=1 Tax=Candidatus Kentrum sp. UNK TaxID=2126344 RepID=A0A451ANL6_9GAMM|nr:MAG: hypothetical protein BECKUNK1418G_GA0071005_11542 [Candidatus Kentron sp. UNK]VFK72876.1 MAG: hypothetical protein BECKUNK1418H_GA0071006_11462 [Candidatus Kentron sp. UNK]
MNIFRKKLKPNRFPDSRDAMNQALLMAASVAASDHAIAEDGSPPEQTTAQDMATGIVDSTATDNAVIDQDSNQETSDTDQPKEKDNVDSENDVDSRTDLPEILPETLLAQTDISMEGLVLEYLEESRKKKDDDDSLDSWTLMNATDGFMNGLSDGLSIVDTTRSSSIFTNQGPTATNTATNDVSYVYGTKFLAGTDGIDTFDYAIKPNDSVIDARNFVINARASNDTILTGPGNDMVRPGEGADTVATGAGDDTIVLVGKTAAARLTSPTSPAPAAAASISPVSLP